MSLPCFASLGKVWGIWRAGSPSLAIVPSAWLCVWADDAPSHATADALWEVLTPTFCNVFPLKKWEHSGLSEHFGFLLQKQELLEFPLWVHLGPGFTLQQLLDCVISSHMDGIFSYRCFTSRMLSHSWTGLRETEHKTKVSFQGWASQCIDSLGDLKSRHKVLLFLNNCRQFC